MRQARFPLSGFILSTCLLPLLWVSPSLADDDKSSTQGSVVQLPSAGGTVQKEAGSFELNSNTGSSTFTLPLPELPSRGHFRPSLALKYSQSSGDSGSGMGVGWSLTVPSLEMNYDKGTVITGFKRNGDFYNRISMNGKRLVFLGTQREGQELLYSLESSTDHIAISYHKVPFTLRVLGENGSFSTVTVPSGFLVRLPDGRKMAYSGDSRGAEGDFRNAAAPLVTKWPLAYEISAQGDMVQFTYEKFGGRSYLKKVAFAGGKSEYRFDLIDTKSHLVNYQNSFPQINGKLYARVTAAFDGDIHAQWCLSYIGRSTENNGGFTVRTHPNCQEMANKDLKNYLDDNSLNVLDQLRMVYRFGGPKEEVLSEKTQQLPSIRFDYSTWTARELGARDLVYEVPAMEWAGDILPRNFELSDLNMDALTDIISTATPGKTSVYFGTGKFQDSFRESKNWELSREVVESGERRTKKVVPVLSDEKFHFADITGDSYVDMVEIEQGKLHLYIGNSQGEFSYLGRPVEMADLSTEMFASGQAKFMDLNMDGLTDIVTTFLDPAGKTKWRIYLNMTTTGANPKVTFGKMEKTFPVEMSKSNVLAERDWRLVDINGDRLPDLVSLRGNYGGFCLYENQGNILEKDSAERLTFGKGQLSDPTCGKGMFVTLKGLGTNDRPETMWYVDVNGDGITDFVNMGERVDQIKIWPGFGDGTFVDQPILLDLNLRVQVGGQAKNFKSRVADLDGDGQAEILIFQKGSGSEVRPVVTIDFNRAGEKQLVKANLLTTVEFDSGLRHDIRYSTSTDELIRDRRLGVSTPNLHFPMVCAKQVITSEGKKGAVRNEVQVTEVFYHRPYYDPINKKFLGFSEVEKVIYGDEFAEGGKSSQKSVYSYEEFYSLSTDPGQLQLAGQLKNRSLFTLAATDSLARVGLLTNSLDPKDAFHHSLSTWTQKQSLPVTKHLIRCEAEDWMVVPRTEGTWFLRKVADRKNMSVALGTAGGEATQNCANYTQKISYEGHDEFNFYTKMVTQVKEVKAPFNLTVPGMEQTTLFDFTESREALKNLGILVSPARITKLSLGKVQNELEYHYDPATGLTKQEISKTFSQMDNVPDFLQRYYRPSRTLVKVMEHDAFGNIVRQGDALGMREQVDYDTDGIFPIRHTRLHGENSSLNQMTLMNYQGERKGFMASFKTFLGLTSQLKYDSLGRRTHLMVSDGAEQRYWYKIAKNGLPTLTLTAFKRYNGEVPAGDRAWIYKLTAHNPDGTALAELENASDNEVRVISYAVYNRNNNSIFEWTPYKISSFAGLTDLNVQKVFELGQIPQPQDLLGQKLGYDELGRARYQDYPSGKVDVARFHPWGKEVTTTYRDTFSGEMAITKYIMEGPLGIAAMVSANAKNPAEVSITRFERDAFGSLRSMHLPGEKTARELIYDTAGKIEYQRLPGMGERFYFYDDHRPRLVAEAKLGEENPGQERKVHVLTYRFDPFNRKTAALLDGKETTYFLYDVPSEKAKTRSFYQEPTPLPLGLMTEVRMVDGNGLFDSVEIFSYDKNGRMVHTETQLGDQVFGESYENTLEGTVRRVRNPLGVEGIYALGTDMRLKSVTMNHPSLADGATDIIEDVTYNAKGRMENVRYRKGAYTQLGYDAKTLSLNRIQSFYENDGTLASLQDLSIDANENGSINTITDNLTLSTFGHIGRGASFEYNWKDELVRSIRYNEDLKFAYGDGGNFLRNEEFSPEDLPILADAKSAMIPVGSVENPYSFNGLGQLQKSPKVMETRYDALGKLVYAKTKTHQVWFGYSHDGKRLYKKVEKLGGSGREGESDKAEIHLFPMKSLIIEPTGPQSFLFVGGLRLGRMEHMSGDWFYYLKDHLGSSDYVMNKDGIPVEQMLYRPYGTELDPLKLSSKWKDHTVKFKNLLPLEKTHHRFTGQYLDDDTGLYYFEARYYDPFLGRFISPDPLFINDPGKCLQSPRECNLFQYAGNNPIKYNDPTGTEIVVQSGTTIKDPKNATAAEKPVLDFRKEADLQLKKLDPSAQVDLSTGKVSFDSTVSTKGHGKGHELLDRVVSSKYVVNVVPHGGGSHASGWTSDGSVIKENKGGKEVEKAGAGSGCTVNWNLNEPFKPTLVNGKIEDPMPRHIVLGHELIHADQGQRGILHIGATAKNVDYVGLDGKLHKNTDIDEARTVGVGKFNDSKDITENMLRMESSLVRRAFY